MLKKIFNLVNSDPEGNQKDPFLAKAEQLSRQIGERDTLDRVDGDESRYDYPGGHGHKGTYVDMFAKGAYDGVVEKLKLFSTLYPDRDISSVGLGEVDSIYSEFASAKVELYNEGNHSPSISQVVARMEQDRKRDILIKNRSLSTSADEYLRDEAIDEILLNNPTISTDDISEDAISAMIRRLRRGSQEQ